MIITNFTMDTYISPKDSLQDFQNNFQTIVGISGLFLVPLSIITSIISLSYIKKNNLDGKNYAIISLVLSSLIIIGLFVLLLIAFSNMGGLF